MGLWGREVAEGFGVTASQTLLLGSGAPQPVVLATRGRGGMDRAGAPCFKSTVHWELYVANLANSGPLEPAVYKSPKNAFLKLHSV